MTRRVDWNGAAYVGSWEGSCFTATGPARPSKDDPRAWYVWLFTHRSNLPKIASVGGLDPDSSARPEALVTDASIKGRRSKIIVKPRDEPDYPQATVADHVPWYFAPRSPTLLRVVDGWDLPYKEGHLPLVLLGIKLGDLAASGLRWCYSDRNAATDLVRFGTDLTALPEFVDFELLTVRDWRNTEDDTDRVSRRAAEVLIYARVPIQLVTAVAASNENTLSVARATLDTCSGARVYRVEPSYLYGERGSQQA